MQMDVLIIDSHVLFRQGLASLLNGDPDFQVIEEAASVESALGQMEIRMPDLVIIDPMLPGWDCLDAVRAIVNYSSRPRILVLTANVDDYLLFGSIQAGIAGCLFKDTPITKVQAALHALHRGEPAISRLMVARILDEFRRISSKFTPNNDALDQLTDREVEILTQLARNATNEEIARQLVISENTVKVHVHNIIKKLNLRNRREAALLAKKSWLAESFYSNRLHS
jgi:DNA-binding NarL/FixJ family response regulator